MKSVKKGEQQHKKNCKFAPNIKESEKSLRVIHKPCPELTDPELKGLNNHLARIFQAKQQKIQEQEVFLLPSQKKALQKFRLQQQSSFLSGLQDPSTSMQLAASMSSISFQGKMMDIRRGTQDATTMFDHSLQASPIDPEPLDLSQETQESKFTLKNQERRAKKA